MTAIPQKDAQLVTPAGESIQPLINGVKIKYTITHPDERGTLCEVYNPAWDISPEPPAYMYQITIRPGWIKGWAMHQEQDDYLFVGFGIVRIVLYDDRAGSPTHKMLNEFYLSEYNRGLVSIPRGVYHAVQNVGQADAILINMPTRPYDHANPDKYRLPINNDLIPYHFDTGSGW